MQRSHRGKAFRGLLEWLANQPTAFWSQGDA
jgi:hypothetical protein